MEDCQQHVFTSIGVGFGSNIQIGIVYHSGGFCRECDCASLAAIEHDYSIAQHHIRPPIDNMDGTKSVPGSIEEYSLDKLRGFAKFFCN